MSNPGFTTKDFDNSPDVQAITGLVRTINETIDIEALMTFYAEDALRAAQYAPGLFHGAQEIRDEFTKRYSQLTERKLLAIDLNVVTNGNMAVAYSQQQIAETGKDKSTNTISVRSHDVFKKQEKGWLILCQHTSVYVDMKNMKGITQQEFIKPGPVNWNVAPFPEAAIDLKEAERQLYEWQVDDTHAQVAEQAMKFYGPGDYLTVYDSRTPPGRMVGMWDVYQGWLPQMQLKRVDDTLTEFRCWTDGQFAALFTLQDFTAYKLEGQAFKSRIRQTDCLHMVDGHWYSYVESVSWPVDEETGKPIIEGPGYRGFQGPDRPE